MHTYYGHPRLDCPNHAPAPAEPDMLTTTTEDGWIVTVIEREPERGERAWWAVDGETLVDVLLRVTNPGDGRDGDAFGWECTARFAPSVGGRNVTIVVQRHEDHDEASAASETASESPQLIGIVHFWIRGVRITGYGARPNEFIPAGSVGDLEVIETTVDARVLQARFHPRGSNGYGLVVHPHWMLIPVGDPDWKEL